MVEELARRSLSPVSSSGRASPVQRQSRRVEDEEPRRYDKTYRRYAAQVERALASFDSTREWPDYISFLSRLLKAIQGQPPATHDIPHRSVIANRLAQCLKPALPSGVHQKALEVYSHIFSIIGKDTLAADLILYLPGLAPVLTFASLSLRPLFLDLIETYILVLNSRDLRPALRSLLLCLLPGLEEENTDDFETSLRIIDGLRSSIKHGAHREAQSTSDDSYFWQSVFFAGISTASRRQGLLTFLTKRMPKLGGADQLRGSVADGPDVDDIATRSLVTPEPGLLVRCFVAGLSDEQLLVQRGYLDLLLSHLPLHSPVLVHNVSDADMETLVGAAVTVVARRDMSLNRRLWSWLLGPQADQNGPSESAQGLPSSPLPEQEPESSGTATRNNSAYFERYGSRYLVRGLLALFGQDSRRPSDRVKPFRISLSLMDRYEIGATIIPRIFVPAMQNIESYKQSAAPEDFDEVLRSAHAFFDGIETGLVWQRLLGLISANFEVSVEDSPESPELLRIACFTLEHFNMTGEDSCREHAASVLLYLIAAINARESETPAQSNLPEMTFVLADRLTELLSHTKATANDRISGPVEVHTCLEICEIISKAYQQNVEQATSILTPTLIESLLSSESRDALLTALHTPELHESIPYRTKLASVIFRNFPCGFLQHDTGLLTSFSQILQSGPTTRGQSHAVPFDCLLSVTQITCQVAVLMDTKATYTHSLLLGLIAMILRGLWDYLSPSFPKYQLETVRCMWQLDDLAPDERLVEASLASSMSMSTQQAGSVISATESARRFAVLWTHTNNMHSATQRRALSIWSRNTAAPLDARSSLAAQESQDYGSRLYGPLLLLLDSSRDTDSELGYFVRNWLESLPSVRVIFTVLVTALSTAAVALPSPATISDEERQQVIHQDRRSELLYYLEAFISILRISADHMWATLIEPAHGTGVTTDLGDVGTLLERLAQECLQIVQNSCTIPHNDREEIDTSIQRTALSLLQCLIRSPEPAILQQYHLENALIQVLMHTIDEEADNAALQVALLDTITATLELQVRSVTKVPRLQVFRRTSSMDAVKTLSRLNLNQEERNTKNTETQTNQALPAQLVKCVQAAIASSSSHHVLDNWITFLTGVLPLYSDAIFQNMIPLVDSFCSRIKNILAKLDESFRGASRNNTIAPEPAILSLLSGLEYVITTGHERMVADELRKQSSKMPEPSQGFFGNVVSGVFASDGQKGRTAVGNSRLTIILCFQDTLKVCVALWGWGGMSRVPDHITSSYAATLGYMSQRLRNKARRILDRMFTDEPLECLETLITHWMEQSQSASGLSAYSATSLLQVLESARPKRIIPALFNSIYSRTSPGAIDANRTSSLTTDIADSDLGQFLVEYTQSLDADAMDEIWNDCMAFIRDVLTNPLPHHNILPSLLIFLVILGEKIESTNFGEQRKMRKDLADSFVRLLTAMFTTRSSGALMEAATQEKPGNGDARSRSSRKRATASDFTIILNDIMPRLPSVVNDNDRLLTVVSNMSTNVFSPLVHARIFPENLRLSYLNLWYNVTKISQASKIWKKDILEALNHAKLFSTPFELVKPGWLPVFKQLLLNDKDRLNEIATRILPPTSAGNIFGVGASAARLDADKKTQLNLRRIALLLMSAEKDYAVSSYSMIEDKLSELINASTASSPSSATRAEVFMVIRALLLKMSHIHLASLWPIITAELQRAISSSLPRSLDYDLYNGLCLVQACKLLDLLLVVAPDDFQMHEWLFITDTIEAVYRPGHWDPVALVDDIAEELGSAEPTSAYPGAELTPMMSSTRRGAKMKSPLLTVVGKEVVESSKPEIVQRLLRPWFAQLSIQAFEATYGMMEVDWEACEEALLRDVFDDSTLVG